jgi:hypothetical protein
VLASVDSASVEGRLPRPDGVSCARNFAFGAKTPWKRVRWARGGGTSAASLAMTSRQDCRFGRPQVARWVAHRDVRHQVHRLKLHVGRATYPAAPLKVRTYKYNAAERLTAIDDNGQVLASYIYDPEKGTEAIKARA